MDATASPTSSKSQKLFGGQDVGRDKDLISKLPEDILVRILSYLSTEEAIKTSILSKRWKYLWPSIPRLSFVDPLYFSSSIKRSDDQILELGATFIGSIERALVLRNSSCLVDVRLVLVMQVGATQLKLWLSAAVKHKVQKLILTLPESGEFVLPNSLFTSKSLNSFWLTMQCTLKVPSFICFSSLKFLRLDNVVFQDDQSVQQLFSGCPVLEELQIYDCDWKFITTVSIHNPTLRSFTFSDRFGPDHHFPNAKIMISALNLETLCVTGRLRVELTLCNVPFLNFASIDIKRWTDGQEHSQQVLKLLSGLHNVKSLNVSNETLESLSIGGNFQGQLPTFYNLTHLKAYVQSPYYCFDNTSGALVYILQKSPNLECLEIPREFNRWAQYMIFEGVPSCFQSSLKEFIIYEVGGNEYEVRLLKYVYENAPFLNRLGIECNIAFWEEVEKQEEIRYQLQQLRGGASYNCVIEFFSYKFPY